MMSKKKTIALFSVVVVAVLAFTPMLSSQRGSLSANVSSYAEYALLSSDATFESVAAVYGAEAQA